MDYLAQILDHKRAELKKLLPLHGKLRAAAIQRNDYAGFRTAVDAGEHRLSLVPQISGTTDSPVSAERLYHMYLQGGANAIAVCTEPVVAHGEWDSLIRVSKLSRVPVLVRDVFIHPVMICQAMIAGADAVNLLPAAVSPQELADMYHMATGLGLDVMLEVHSLHELEQALDLEPDLICLNNTNPHTGVIDTALTEKLIDEIPAAVTVLAAGGIDSLAVAQRMLEAGVNGLILQQELASLDIPQDFMTALADLRCE